jgi:hypothetical protein
MLNRETVFGLVVTLGCAVSLSAQSTTTPRKPSTSAPNENELSVVGCLSKTAGGGFTLTNAQVESATAAAAAGSRTTPASGSTATTGTVGAATTRPTEPAGSGPSGRTTWALEGGSDLEKHVGHKVQVTGRSQAHQATAAANSATSSSSAAGTTGSTAGSDEGPLRTLEVQSIKMIATSCS